MKTKKSKESEVKKLNHSIEELTNEIDESNSNKKSFIKGIFLGVGTTLGATIITAVIVTILVWLLSVFQDVPFVSDIIDWLNIDKYIDSIR